MKQILQNLGTGVTLLADVPSPRNRSTSLLIQTYSSLVSIGTEKMLMEFGKANIIDKARQQPDKVRMVLNKIRTDGLFSTIDAVKSKLDQPIPLGYCNAGTVIEVGSEVTGFSVGDRVISNGPHAEYVSVPVNLCARIPDSVSFDEAAFTVVGSIGLQGIRLAEPTLGESFVVTGLGLIGLLCVQLLRAHGCRVLGIDFDSNKCARARDFGADTVDLSKGEDPLSAATIFSKGRGVDGVLITASTKSNEPVSQAARMCRKRGRIVLVGVVGLELSRSEFYEKELTFQVSCSYGPGRYDPEYEQKGFDYPFGLVRWTENRNFEAMLDMMADRRVDVASLITHRFPLDEALAGYAEVSKGGALGVLIEYDVQPSQLQSGRTIVLSPPVGTRPAENVVVGAIGAGNFAGQVLLPALAKTGARLKSIASSIGVSGAHFGKKFSFEQTTTDVVTIFTDSDINTVLITTRHDSHAGFVCAALRAGKHLFVEKPLALNEQEIESIVSAYEEAVRLGNTPLLMVGFNRRFAPHVTKMKTLLDAVREPKTMIMTVNAGSIPPEHWVHDPKAGGGRIIGEGCHFIDLLRFLVGHPIVSVQSAMIGDAPGVITREDKMTFTLLFQDGSLGTVHYFANGSKEFPKERLDVFCAGRVLQLDNFKTMTGYGWPGFKKMSLWSQDKGHGAEMVAFIDAVRRGGPPLIPFEELVEVARVSFLVRNMAEKQH